jgi:hypothetical protein
MISLAFRLRSLLESNPGPEIGQMRDARAPVSPGRQCPSNSEPQTTFQIFQYDHLDQFCVTRIFLVSASLVSPVKRYHRLVAEATVLWGRELSTASKIRGL